VGRRRRRGRRVVNIDDEGREGVYNMIRGI